MSKYTVCKHTLSYDKLVKTLKDHDIEFKTKDCIKKCSKCRSKILIKKDDDYISAKTIDKLLSKLNLDSKWSLYGSTFINVKIKFLLKKEVI